MKNEQARGGEAEGRGGRETNTQVEANWMKMLSSLSSVSESHKSETRMIFPTYAHVKQAAWRVFRGKIYHQYRRSLRLIFPLLASLPLSPTQSSRTRRQWSQGTLVPRDENNGKWRNEEKKRNVWRRSFWLHSRALHPPPHTNNKIRSRDPSHPFCK